MLVDPTQPPKRKRIHKPRRPRKLGPMSQAEKNLVAQVVTDSALEPTSTEIKTLAVALRRSPTTIKKTIDEARDKFVESAKDYVEMHKEAVVQALANGSVDGLEQAIKGSQWAMEHISGEGSRIVEKEAKSEGGVKVMVGVKVGGMNTEITSHEE